MEDCTEMATCVRCDENTDLTIGKVYLVISKEENYICVIDDSGQESLYPKECFQEIHLND